MAPKLSLIFPCYCEEPHLEENIDRVIQTLSLINIDYEMIFVDDRSPDGTRTVIEKIIRKYPALSLKKIFHSENQGRGAAFLTGFGESSGEYVGFFDVDLEVSPVYVLECLRQLMNSSADLVLGKRYYKVNFSIFYRHVLSVGYSFLVSRLLSIPMSLDSESGYKFFRRSALQNYVGKFLNKGWFWDTEVVSRFVWDKKKVAAFPCLFVRNGTKRSTVKPLKDAIDYFQRLVQFRYQMAKLNRLEKKEAPKQVEASVSKAREPLAARKH